MSTALWMLSSFWVAAQRCSANSSLLNDATKSPAPSTAELRAVPVRRAFATGSAAKYRMAQKTARRGMVRLLFVVCKRTVNLKYFRQGV